MQTVPRVIPMCGPWGIETRRGWSIAPAGLALYQGDLFVGALKFKQVHRVEQVNGEFVDAESLFGELGSRIRDVRAGPDGYLYLLTDSNAGKLIRVVPGNPSSASPGQ